MGWLELLPLLKRLLPLLSQVAPMLETVVVARSGNGKEATAALGKLAGEMKSEFATAAENHAALMLTLNDHSGQLQALRADVQRLHSANSESDARLQVIEKQIAALAKAVRTSEVVTLLLLLLGVALLLVTLLRH